MAIPQTFENCEIQSGLFLLRPLALTDLDAVYIAGNDAEIQRWLPLPFPYLKTHAQWFIEEFSKQRQSAGAGLVNAIEYEGKFAGVIDIKRTDWLAQTCEIGYWTSPWARGKGITSLAVVELTNWIMNEKSFQRVELRVAPGNLASQRVAEKAGYTKEGIARNAGFTNNGRVDLTIYSWIPADF